MWIYELPGFAKATPRQAIYEFLSRWRVVKSTPVALVKLRVTRS